MGCYETINVKCAWCKKRTSSQSKILGDCEMNCWGEGDIILNNSYANCIFGLKEECEHCKKQVNIIIKDKEIIRTTKNDAEYTEELWGDVK